MICDHVRINFEQAIGDRLPDCGHVRGVDHRRICHAGFDGLHLRCERAQLDAFSTARVGRNAAALARTGPAAAYRGVSDWFD